MYSGRNLPSAGKCCISTREHCQHSYIDYTLTTDKPNDVPSFNETIRVLNVGHTFKHPGELVLAFWWKSMQLRII